MTDLRDEIYPHINAEFFIWLLYCSEIGKDTEIINHKALGDVELIWMDKLSFRDPQQETDKTVVAGEDAAHSVETKAALISGKTLQEAKLMLRLNYATYGLTLKGDYFDISGFKQLTAEMDAIEMEDGDSVEVMLLLRMQEYEDIWSVIEQLFTKFVTERVRDDWYKTIVQEIRAWVHED